MEFELYIKAVKNNDFEKVKHYYCDEYLNKYDENDLNGFHHACNLGYMEIVKFFLDKNVDIGLPCQNNDWQGLHLTVESGYEKIGKLLLSLGADKEARAMKGMRPIHCAALGDSVEAVRMLLIEGVDFNALNELNETPLHIAKRNNCHETVKLLEKWMGYNQVFNLVISNQLETFKDCFLKERILIKDNQTKLTILEFCVKYNKPDFLEFIFLQNPDQQSVIQSLKKTLANKQIPSDQFLDQFRLYRSILFDNREEFLENINVEICNQPWILTGDTFLELCCRYNRVTYVNKILERILDVEQSCNRAIDIADRLGHISVVKKIKSRVQFVKNRTKAFYNRLHIAVQDNNIEMIKYILDNNLIDANKNDASLGSPLCLALSLGYTEAVLAFRDYNLEMDVVNRFDQTPLHLAIESNMMNDSFDFIYPKVIDAVDFYGFTPLHLAIINKDSNLSHRLIECGADVWKPLTIRLNGSMEKISLSTIVPLTKVENPITLCMKLYRTLFPSMLPKINHRICTELLDDGNSVLHLASKLLIPGILETLIANGSNINLQNKIGNTPLHSAFLESFTAHSWEMEGFMETAQLLTERGANINILNNEGKSVFQCAMDVNSKKILNMVLNHCQRVDVDVEDLNLLYCRQWPDSLKIVFDLQDDNFKKCALTKLITESQLDFIDFLLDIVDDEFVKSIVEELLLVAAQSDEEIVFDRLLEYNIKEPKIMSDGETVLTRLIRNTDEKYCVKICDSDFSDFLVDMKNQKSQTPLHLAASKGFLKLFKRLLIECQHINEIYQKCTPIEILIDQICRTNDKRKLTKLEKIVKLMMKNGLDIYQTLQSGSNIISKFINKGALKGKLEKSHEKMKANAEKEEEPEDINICEICLSKHIDCQFGCGHPLCKECATRVNMCPKCRKPKSNLIPLFI